MVLFLTKFWARLVLNVFTIALPQQATKIRSFEKIFIWAYRCRISQYSVQLATIDNYVLERNIFSLLKYAQSPSELIGWSLPIVDKQEGTKVEPLITLFKELNYLKQEDQYEK